jgi:excisionase family DNA binding protein
VVLVDRLLTAAEVAGRLGVKTSWVEQAARDGRLPHVMLGRYRRFHLPDVEKWVEANKRLGRAA